MIRIGITAHPTKHKGIDHLKDAGQMFECRDLMEAMREEWADDAWFCCYAPVEGTSDLASLKASDPWPRINKPCLSHIRSVGGEVRSNLFAYDYDLNLNVSDEVLKDYGWDGNPRKRPKIKWDPTRVEEFNEALERARAHFEDRGIGWANYIYTTAHGARFIHVLAKGVPVDESEGFWRGLSRIYGDAGMTMDKACDDWTRLFRLPKVVREGQPTSESPYFTIIEQFDEFLETDGLTPVPSARAQDYGTIEPLDLPLPDPDACASMLEVKNPDTGRYVMTEAFKAARKALKGRECYGPLFDYQEIQEGSRDDMLMKFVGQACSLLHGISGMTPEFIYALFLPLVDTFEPDAGTPSWQDSAWGKILRCWAREEAKARREQEKQVKAEEDRRSKMEILLDRARRWNPNLTLDELRQSLLVCTPSATFHVMREEGYYSTAGVKSVALRAWVRNLGMDDVIQLERLNGNKVVRPRTDELLDLYGTVVGRVEGRVACKGAHLEDVGTDHACLVLPIYRRASHEPTFNADVDNWLKALCGNTDTYLRLCKWIGYSLDFEAGSICALSMAGPPSVGKKLLARGLAETIEVPFAASGADLIADFNAVLGKTPWLVVDEGLPSRIGGMDVADTFRRVVAGEEMWINDKFQTVYKVRNPMRVIFTANNTETVRRLAAHRDLSLDDQHAIGKRIFHIDASEKAAQFLACPRIEKPDFGGLAFTRGWIAGDAGQQSDFVVAKHFLWLYENRESYGRPEPRFIVEGNVDAKIMDELAVNSGAAPDIIECIIDVLEHTTTEYHSDLAIEKNEVFVTARAVLDAYRSGALLKGRRRMLDVKKVARVLEALQPRYALRTSSARLLTTMAGTDRRVRWWHLDLERIYDLAVESGRSVPKIEALVEQRINNEQPNS